MTNEVSDELASETSTVHLNLDYSFVIYFEMFKIIIRQTAEAFNVQAH